MRTEAEFSQKLEDLVNDPQAFQAYAQCFTIAELNALICAVFVHSTQPLTKEGLEKCAQAVQSAQKDSVTGIITIMHEHFDLYKDVHPVMQICQKKDLNERKDEYASLQKQLEELQIKRDEAEDNYRKHVKTSKSSYYAEIRNDLDKEIEKIEQSMQAIENSFQPDFQQKIIALEQEEEQRKSYALHYIDAYASSTAIRKEEVKREDFEKVKKELQEVKKQVEKTTEILPLPRENPELTQQDLELVIQRIPNKNERKAAELLLKQKKLTKLVDYLIEKGYVKEQ